MKPGGSHQRGFALLNPWLWLGFLIMLALAGFTGYRQGVKATTAEYETAAVKAMQAMIARHNEMAKADADAAAAAEKKRQARRIKDLEVRHELELEAARNHRPECAWSDLERGLLNALIDSANGQAHASPGVPDGLRPPAADSGPQRPGDKEVGSKRGLKFWRMSQPAR